MTTPTALPLAELPGSGSHTTSLPKAPLESQNTSREPLSSSGFPIFDLPPEIHLLILPHLDFPSAISLRSTCHYFHNLFPEYSLLALRNAFIIQLYYDCLGRHERVKNDTGNGELPCHTCLKLRPRPSFDRWERYSVFPILQLAITNPADGEVSPRRVCVSCKLRRGLFAEGAQFNWRGQDYVLCKECRRVGRANKPVAEKRSRGFCPHCRVKDNWLHDWPLAFLEAVFITLAVLTVVWSCKALRESGKDQGVLWALSTVRRPYGCEEYC